MPVLSVFAGPNGSGKSSIIRLTGSFEGKENLLEPDAVAKKFTTMRPREAAIAAGREVIQRCREYIHRTESFAIETTLSGNWTTAAVRTALDSGYQFRFFFICLDSPDRNVDRVRERVQQGGHDVPEIDIRRRYQRSLLNAAKLMKFAHEAFVFDNSGRHAELMIETRAGQVVYRAPSLRAWAEAFLRDDALTDSVED